MWKIHCLQQHTNMSDSIRMTLVSKFRIRISLLFTPFIRGILVWNVICIGALYFYNFVHYSDYILIIFYSVSFWSSLHIYQVMNEIFCTSYSIYNFEMHYEVRTKFKCNLVFHLIWHSALRMTCKLKKRVISTRSSSEFHVQYPDWRHRYK